MNPLNVITRPEYAFQPAQIARRILAQVRSAGNDVTDVRLPWGAPITIRISETMGRTLQHHRVHELNVSECLWRLLDEGENAIDVGANIGYMTSLLAARSGPRGHVVSFEPHPEVFRELEENVSRWPNSRFASITLFDLALSDRSGFAILRASPGHRSSSTLEAGGEKSYRWRVRCTRLDELACEELQDLDRVHVAKLDVEGYEKNVLLGAEGCLRKWRVRDIIFEEHGTPPTPVTELLEAQGYRVFHIDNGPFWGPGVHDLKGGYRPRPGQSPNCLATLDSERAKARLRPRGWRVLRG